MKPKRVIVIWGTPHGLKDRQVSILTHSGGTRIYEKDNVDGRLLTDKQPSLPYFDDIDSAFSYMQDNPNFSVQLDLNEAYRCNLV